MRVIIDTEFDFDMGNGMVMHCLPTKEAIPIKIEVGTYAVEQGFAREAKLPVKKAVE